MKEMRQFSQRRKRKEKKQCDLILDLLTYVCLNVLYCKNTKELFIF